MTGAGVHAGHRGVHSPEQAKGRPRPAQRSVGVRLRLYEMLAGERTSRATISVTRSVAVLQTEPDWSHCRDANAEPVSALLRAVSRRTGEPTAETRRSQPHRNRRRDEWRPQLTDQLAPPPLTRTHVADVAAALAVATLAAVGTMLDGSGPGNRDQPRLVRLPIALPTGQQFTSPGHRPIALSPDGSVISSTRRTSSSTCVPMADPVARPIAGASTQTNMGAPAVSPDGQSVAFWVRTGPPNPDRVVGEIRRVPVAGGPPFTVAALDGIVNGLSWEGEWLLFGQADRAWCGFVRVDRSQELIARVEEGQQAQGPQFVGDDAVLFVVKRGRAIATTQEWDQAEMVVQSLTSRERKALGRGSAARVLPTGHIVFVQRGVVMAAPFDVRRKEMTGPPVPVLQGVLRAITGGPGGAGQSSLGSAHFAVSDTGAMAYVAGPPSGSFDERRLVLVDRAGTVEALPPATGAYDAPRVSPDGKRLAVVTTHSDTTAISIYELYGTSALRRLTLEGNNRFPVWSVDGQRMAFQSDREKDLGIFWQRVDGSPPIERLTRARRRHGAHTAGVDAGSATSCCSAR